MSLQTVSTNKCFGGTQGVYSHASEVCGCDMTFGLFLPEEAQFADVPLLWYLSGLTCTHENAMTKAGAQAWAAEHGIALLFPDTSPRGDDVPNDEAYDLGQGAGFYIDAVAQPWATHFQMESYIARELPELVLGQFNIDPARQSITGHSMGGHGALSLAMKYQGRFRSVSAFSPICNPTGSDWGRKQFAAYLGEDEAAWAEHDASVLLSRGAIDSPMLIDVGSKDNFWDLLKPSRLASAMTDVRQEGHFRVQKGYDHSYFFVSSFIEEHLAFHADALYS